MKFYFVIPSCNGEVMDSPYIVYNLPDIKDIECLVYELSFNIDIREVDF